MNLSKRTARNRFREKVLRNYQVAVLLLALLPTPSAFVVVGQQQETKANKDKLTLRIESAISTKEPGFKLANSLQRKTNGENYVMQVWRSGEHFVSATTYELDSVEGATQYLKDTINPMLMSVPVKNIKVADLGDEAYLRTNGMYSPKGHSQVFFRKGKLTVILSASDPDIALRFSRLIAEEME
jgi:hypothetical protein